MLQRLLSLIALPLLIESGLRLLWLVCRKPDDTSSISATLPETPTVQIVIPAHNEQAVIYDTVMRLMRQTYPAACMQIIVLADNCTDKTWMLARQAGAQVSERNNVSEPGKGAALRWWLAHPQSKAYDLIAIFDADSQVDENFLACSVPLLLTGADVVQGFVAPLSEAGTVGVLSGYSELLGQLIDDAGRATLGWPVPLRGTGMLFRSNLLRRLAPQIVSQAEDMELSLLLAANRATVVFAPNAHLLDPKPINRVQAENQRARWLRGQWQAVRAHPVALVTALLLRGPGSFALTLSLLLRPKVLYLAAKVLLALIAVANSPVERGTWRKARLKHTLVLPIALGVALLIDGIYYLAGLRYVERPEVYTAALHQVPHYSLLWLQSLLKPAHPRAGWFSARHGGSG